jgi:hypothetical protein
MDDTLYHYCRSHYRIINIEKDIDDLESVSFFYTFVIYVLNDLIIIFM